MENNIFSKAVLFDELYEDIKSLSELDKRYNTTFLTSNYFSLVAYILNNRYYISMGHLDRTSTGMMVMNVGSSGVGKSFSQKVFTDPLDEIQERNSELAEIFRDFSKACKAYANSDSYRDEVKEIMEAEDIKENRAGTELKEKFASQWYWANKNNNSLFEKYKLKEEQFQFGVKPKFYTYLIKDFTPEGLKATYPDSPNNSLYCIANEFDELIGMTSNSGAVGNPYTFLINQIDGVATLIVRKTAENIYIKGSTNFLCSTTHSEFQQTVGNTRLFPSGLGFRTFFAVDEIRNIDINTPIKWTDKSNATIPIKEKIADKVRMFVEVFLGREDDWEFRIKDPEILEYYNKKRQEINKEFFTEKQVQTFSRDHLNSIQSRFDFNLLKTILIVHIMNNLYVVDRNAEHFGKPQPWHEIGKDSIDRGFAAYRFFLQNTFDALRNDGFLSKLEFTASQIEIINLMEIGETIKLNELVKRGMEKDIPKSSTYSVIYHPRVKKVLNRSGQGKAQSVTRIQ